MVESPLTRLLLRIGTGLTLAFIYGPLIVIALYAFNRNVTQKWPIEDYSTRWFRVAFNDDGVREALTLSVLARRGDHRRARPRHVRFARGRALRFFGREAITFARDPSDRPARDRHRARAPGHDPRRPRPARRPVRAHDDHRRPRDVLRRRRLQQRGRPNAADSRVARRGVGRPRCRLLADVPVRDVPADADRAPRGRPCSRSPCRSTRSSSPSSPRAPSRRSRSGSSRPSPGPPSCHRQRRRLFVIVVSIIPVYIAQRLAGAAA